MKREIKFRAWHRASKLMYWWNLLWGNHRHGDGYIGMVLWGEEQTKHGIYRDNMTLIDPDNCEIMQFTGLKDKNGKEIYEGDIVKIYGSIASNDPAYGHYEPFGDVAYHTERAMFIIHNGYSEPLFEKAFRVEIIGNIYENPELL